MWSLANCWYTAESFVPVAFSLQPCHLHHYCWALSWWRAAFSYLNSMPGVTRLSLYWLKLCDSYFTSILITDPWGSHVEPTCCVLKKHLVSSWALRYDLNPYSADFCFAGSGINNANVNNLVSATITRSVDAKGSSNMKLWCNKPKWWFHSHSLLVINVQQIQLLKCTRKTSKSVRSPNNKQARQFLLLPCVHLSNSSASSVTLFWQELFLSMPGFLFFCS